MDCKKDYSCIERNEKVFFKNIDIEEDFNESIPAYCDDIYRVVKCVAHSFITSMSISSDEIKIFGKTEIMLTYYNENSCLCYADFEEEFTKCVNADNLSDSAFPQADICDKYTNFRVINQRRIDVHSSALICLSVYDKVKCPSINSCEGAKLKRENIKSADIIASNISKIEFDEEFSIPADSSPVKRIISSLCSANLIETKIIKDKVLVKAVVTTDILYTSGGDDEEILKASNSFNVSKIIDQSSIDEDDIMITNISAGNIFQKAKAASGDELNIIEVFGEIIINSVFIRESENAYITDGYMLKRGASCSYSDFNAFSNGKYISDSTLLNLSLEFSNDIKEIKEISILLSPPVSRNSKLVSKAEALIVYENESGALASMTSGSDIEIDSQDREFAFAALSVKSTDYTITNSKRLDLRLNVDLSGYFYDEMGIKVLSDIEAGEEKADTPSLTIYFGKENESVWSIAKSFSSDADLIIKENDLNNDILDSNKVLIIPRA